jgi:hypothetical protein
MFVLRLQQEFQYLLCQRNLLEELRLLRVLLKYPTLITERENRES